MSIFEKVVVAMIDPATIKLIDLTDTAGFLDAYTYDPDNPGGLCTFYLTYDASKHNEYTQDRARRFSNSRRIKKCYVKYVNNNPILIYSFWVNDNIKGMFSKVGSLTISQKQCVINFWGVFSDVSAYILGSNNIYKNPISKVPLKDYQPDYFQTKRFTIKNEDSVSK